MRVCYVPRTIVASYTVNSVRTSPNGEIVVKLSLKIRTRPPGLPDNLLETRDATRVPLSLAGGSQEVATRTMSDRLFRVVSRTADWRDFTVPLTNEAKIVVYEGTGT